MDTVPVHSVWILEGVYVKLLNHPKKLSVYYESHENWFTEITDNTQLLEDVINNAEVYC